MRASRSVSVLVAVLLLACGDPAAPGGPPDEITALPRPLTTVESEMVSASNSFGFNLLKEVNKSFADSNVFLSPLSASMALGMTMNGAEGATFEEMRSALGFGPRTYQELNTSYQSLIALLRELDPQVEFKIANAIYYDLADIGTAVEPTFLTESKTYFDAEVKGLDFRRPEAVDTVNDWANRNTNGKIPRVIDSIEAQIVMLLMNAIYFKGDWRAAFKPSQTVDDAFHAPRGDITVRMMNRKGGFRQGRLGNATVAELPYGGDAFVMTILLPDEGVNIETFVAGLNAGAWAQSLTGLHDADADLALPKFTLAWEDLLNDELKALGMRQAFVPDGAQFTRISRSMGTHLYIDKVKQKAFVEVNEVGTEAAAVTVVEVGVTSAPMPVRIDRPFVFAIRERLSGTVLFLGKIVAPKYPG